MAISGRLLADLRRFPSGCSGLLELYRIDGRRVDGRTELQLPECPASLLQGWRVQATGVLRRPLPAVHPLLPGSAERLARQGSWSQLRVESIEVLQRPWTPLASEAWSRGPGRRPLNCGNARGRVERWQSPVDRARLEIV